MDCSKLRIIDFLELYRDVDSKEKIDILIIKGNEEIECNLENFRKVLNGLEYEYYKKITMSDNYITIVIGDDIKDEIKK